ncbi:hypothetical protein PR001_g26109 [Phytophthora rubi]|uniref:Stc1 domain-containing protein n=1 Tax=Phytophthora rubi TaxID=129364 RepID=A0A6A3HVP0_9STRA|nr:hypothetical protein PR002_g29267 [Phytophthora rubi]KAE8974080.1 hypothetical protein PR001_g26109 [Phytophthora rubi]
MASSPIAPYDDGSSTESECYDEELLELAKEVQKTENDPKPAPNSAVSVKVEPSDSATNDQTSSDFSSSAAVKSEDAAETKTKPTYNKCKRCRRKLPVVSEHEKLEVQQGKLPTKRCACCEEHFPLSKFSKSNGPPTRAISRCRACAQAPPNVWQKLVKCPEYAEAVAAEMQQRKEENKKKRVNLPQWERKTVKQRYEEQFELRGGKTARARRLAHREEEKKKRLAAIRNKQNQSKKK